ncbi:MAG: glycosyltransferase [Nitrospinales bacterium]
MEWSCLKVMIGMQKRGVPTTLLLRSREGDLIKIIPKEINIVNFSKNRMLTTLFPLIRYLRREKPAALISHFYPVNIVVVMAKILARRDNFHLTIVEHNTLSKGMKDSPLKQKITLLFMRWLYPKADKIVGVSDGVSRDLENCLGLEKNSVTTIYNGVIDDGFFERANEPLEHEWFQAGKPPVILAVGRFVSQKDFSNLLHAFALLRKKRVLKLMIVGDGELRSQLEKMVKELSMENDVLMPGFDINPLKYYKKCAVFVLSSKWEGLPGVLLEALACGCTVVATDCPSGPSEILDNGKYGYLVPVGDSQALADGMGKAMDSPLDPASLVHRAKDFSVENAVSNYLSTT